MEDHSIDLYMQEVKREHIESIEMQLYTELSQLPQDRNAQVTGIVVNQAKKDVSKAIEQCEDQNILPGKNVHNGVGVVYRSTENVDLLGTNFLLATIAFLLFLIIWLK